MPHRRLVALEPVLHPARPDQGLARRALRLHRGRVPRVGAGEDGVDDALEKRHRARRRPRAHQPAVDPNLPRVPEQDVPVLRPVRLAVRAERRPARVPRVQIRVAHRVPLVLRVGRPPRPRQVRAHREVLGELPGPPLERRGTHDRQNEAVPAVLRVRLVVQERAVVLREHVERRRGVHHERAADEVPVRRRRRRPRRATRSAPAARAAAAAARKCSHQARWRRRRRRRRRFSRCRRRRRRSRGPTRGDGR